MRLRELEKSKELAEEHWVWLESILRKIFIDAFVHGYKHAKDKEKKE